MQLFYHATRDIELPATIRRGPPPRAPGQCEACGRPLTAAESRDPGHGLAFCAACRDRLDRSAEQEHHCDACRVRVPADAIRAGAAILPDGRILCASCRRPVAERGSRTVWIAVLAAAALASGAALALLL